MAGPNKEFLSFDDEIADDGQSNILLPEGDYVFEVANVERGRFPGGAKIPECNKVSLTLDVKTEQGTAKVWCDLILHRSVEWKISAFFRSIGLKKRGEPLKMDWNKAFGAQGKAHMKPRTYKNSSGEEKTVNDVERFLDWDPDGDLPF